MKKPPCRAMLNASTHLYTRAIVDDAPTRLYVACMNLYKRF
jgi:hypothetical protein